MLIKWAVLVVCAFTLFGPGALAQSSRDAVSSAKRGPNESWDTAYQRFHLKRAQSKKYQALGYNDSAYEMAVKVNQLDYSQIPDLSISQIEKVFSEVRDRRFLKDLAHGNMMRRSTWLYPDDGCFARTELAVEYLQKSEGVTLPKLFAFGDLEVATANAPGGKVAWWYHVVPVVKSGTQVFVLDPAVESHRPLEVGEWYAQIISNTKGLLGSVCSAQTYDPDSLCQLPSSEPFQTSLAIADQGSFLNLEWDRVLSLGRDPVQELGDVPPWSFFNLGR